MISSKSFKALHGKNTDAITTSAPYEMVFHPGSLTLGIVRHEVAHAYLSASLLESSNKLSLYDQEENFCETFRLFGPLMLKHSKEIYNKLIKLKGKK